jgi:hypothetical protein
MRSEVFDAGARRRQRPILMQHIGFQVGERHGVEGEGGTPPTPVKSRGGLRRPRMLLTYCCPVDLGFQVPCPHTFALVAPRGKSISKAGSPPTMG